MRDKESLVFDGRFGKLDTHLLREWTRGFLAAKNAKNTKKIKKNASGFLFEVPNLG
jgi:hypothetical protein